MSNLVGKSIDRYRVDDIVANYPDDCVYKAYDCELERMVFLKIPHHRQHKRSRIILRNKARRLAKLRHPHIHTVHDLREMEIEGESSLILVMDYLNGGVLSSLYEQDAISRMAVVRVVYEVASAVAFAHRRGILHRNVTPKQIRFDSEGRAQLGGFGLAVSIDDAQEKSNKLTGTPAYMAPEQVDPDDDALGPFTDIWGLGVTLYQGLTGRLPFGQAASTYQLFHLICEAEPEWPDSLDSTISSRLSEICQKCLRKSPGDRYTTADELVEDLRSCLTSEDQTHRNNKVFISHSSRDRDVVEKLIIATLESAGIRTWYSKIDIQSAVDWERTLRDGLKTSDWFLVVISENSIASEWVKDEVYWAIDERPGRIIPVLIDDSPPRDLHIRLERLQAVDFTRGSSEPRDRLLSVFGMDSHQHDTMTPADARRIE